MNAASNTGRGKSRAAFPQAERSAAQASRAGRSPELHQERAVQTRLQVLEAAATLFDQRGYAGTSIKDVADHVGMTKGAVYFHYPTKEALTVAVVEAHYARWPVLLETSQSKGLGPLDTVMDLLDQTAVTFRDDPIVRGGARLQMEQPLAPGALPTPYVGWIDLLRQLLTEAQDTGELRSGVTPAAAAHTLVALLFGAQHIFARLDRRSELVQQWTDSRDLVFHSLRA